MSAALLTKLLEMKIRSELQEIGNRMEAREASHLPETRKPGHYTGTQNIGSYEEPWTTANPIAAQEAENHTEKLETQNQTETVEEANRARMLEAIENIFAGRAKSGKNEPEAANNTPPDITIHADEQSARMSRTEATPTIEKAADEPSAPQETNGTEDTGAAGALPAEIAQNTQTGAVEIKAAHTKKKQSAPAWKELLFLTVKVASIVLVFAMLFTFLFGIMRYQEPSMAPMIKDGDLVVFYRYTKSGYLPRDVVAFDYNGNRLVRRVVATAGDTVDITDRGLVINGALQQETEIYRSTEQYQEGISFPVEVPDGHVFVLSDHRTDATDSRVFGNVKIENTLGKVMAIIRRRNI